MAAIVDALRSGRWLTPQRLAIYPAVLTVAYVAVIIVGFATANGPLDPFGRPLGTDFSEVWVAGRSVLAGHPERPFDSAVHFAAERQAFGATTPLYGWHYPPYFLAVAAAAALLPYIPALLVWQGVTLALYVASIWFILPGRRALVGALGFPAVFVNLGHGHNGFLTASLLGGAMLLLQRRPAVAGVLIGLLAYKPQFGLIVPLALLADRRWTTVAAAAATVAVMTLASFVAFGAATWQAFRESLRFSREVVLEAGATGWEKIQSTFAAVRAVGGSIAVAYAVQALVTAAVICGVAWLWHSGSDRRLKAAALIVGTLLATPYVLDYDMVALAPALAFTVAHGRDRGFRPWECSVMALVWIVPLVARSVARITDVPIGLLAMLAFFAMILMRGLEARGGTLARQAAAG